MESNNFKKKQFGKKTSGEFVDDDDDHVNIAVKEAPAQTLNKPQTLSVSEVEELNKKGTKDFNSLQKRLGNDNLSLFSKTFIGDADKRSSLNKCIQEYYDSGGKFFSIAHLNPNNVGAFKGQLTTRINKLNSNK